MGTTEQVAGLAATLMDEAHFIQSSTKLRPAYYSVPSAQKAASDAVTLFRIGRCVKRWAERECNGIERYQGNGIWCGTWTEQDIAQKERADMRALAAATEIAARYGATASISGDPRGFVLYLHFASGRKNGLGEGFGIV